MNEQKFPFDPLPELKQGEEIIIHWNGENYLVSKATLDDVNRLNRGYYLID